MAFLFRSYAEWEVVQGSPHTALEALLAFQEDTFTAPHAGIYPYIHTHVHLYFSYRYAYTHKWLLLLYGPLPAATATATAPAASRVLRVRRMYQEKLGNLAQKAASAQGLVELHRSDHGTAGMGGASGVVEECHVMREL